MADGPQRQTLDIPHGVSFTIADNTITLGNEADVVIRGDLGYKMRKVFSKDGNVQILPPEGSVLTIEELEARKGDVHVHGHVNANSVRAKKVFFEEGFLKADRVEGDEEVHLKGKRFQILFTKAPTVTIDPDAKGLALVVECKHEVPEGKFMGGFPNVDEAKKTWQSFNELFGGGGGPSQSASAATAAAADKQTAKAGGAAAGEGDDEGTSEQIKKFFQKQ